MPRYSAVSCLLFRFSLSPSISLSFYFLLLWAFGLSTLVFYTFCFLVGHLGLTLLGFFCPPIDMWKNGYQQRSSQISGVVLRYMTLYIISFEMELRIYDSSTVLQCLHALIIVLNESKGCKILPSTKPIFFWRSIPWEKIYARCCNCRPWKVKWQE